MTRLKLLTIFLFLCSVPLISPTRQATADYSFVDLGVLSGWSFSEAGNIAGVYVVGRCLNPDGGMMGFIWSPGGGMRSLGTAGGAYSMAYGVNRLGNSVGMSQTSDGLELAFYKPKRGQMVALPYLPSPFPYSRAYAINQLGQIVGFSNNEFANFKACIWWDPTSSDPPENLGNLTGDPLHNSRALGINDSSEVVGDSIGTNGYGRPIYWSRATGMIDLGTLGGASGRARGISNRGHVVGGAENSDGYCEAFHINVHAARPKMRGLGGLGGSGTYQGIPTISYAYSVNDAAMIVGYAYNAANEQVAVLWTRTNGIQDLNTLVSDLPPGVVLRNAIGINSYGYIVGYTADDRAYLLVGGP